MINFVKNYRAMKRYLLILLSFACISLAAQDRKSTKSINDEVLFAPEFHAYSHGRINNEQGEGRKWYNRFKVMHISIMTDLTAHVLKGYFTVSDPVLFTSICVGI